ncbi:MAG TPA: preprotein translocase subunit SecY, partial [Terriglobia bacterium]|nr:preprotein translocase subunit SecY [Terriglobia bacterium]
MIQAIQNIWNVPELKKRVGYMLGLLIVYRIGAYIPIPYIDPAALEQWFSQNAGTVLGFLDLFAGGSLRRLTVFALGIMPYITASIILQLLTVVWPYLEKLSKEGELGRRKITTYTRYLTVVLSAIQSATMAMAFQRTAGVVTHPGLGFILMTMITLTAGTAFIMWLGEQITERGIGNGMSLIIFAGIVVRLPSAIIEIYQNVSAGDMSPFTVIIIVAVIIAIVAFVVLVERGQRRITVQYAKRVVGRRVLGGQS